MQAPDIEHLTVHGDGITLHVARAGEGPPVVLLHGFPENWTSWRHQIAPLVAAGFSVWMPDLRGYGTSEKPAHRGAYAKAHLVSDVAVMVRATGHAKASVVGHDWGGLIAWGFASQYPALLDRLVILNAPHPRIYLKKLFTTLQIFRSWYVLFFQLPIIPELLISSRNYQAIRETFRNGPAVPGTFTDAEIDGYVEAISAPGALTAGLNYYRANFWLIGKDWAAAAPIEAPTLVIWGERDPFLDLALLDGLEAVAPRVIIHRIPDSSHWVQNERPEEVNASLVRFLTSGR
jgi:pimeloyl-ACP methyl ester carboxylesterase